MNVCIKCRGEAHVALHFDVRVELFPACPDDERDMNENLAESEFGSALIDSLIEVREGNTQ